MLYDTRWDAKTETRPVPTLAGLIAWLEKQPRDTQYDFMNCQGACLVGQYFRSTGIHRSSETIDAAGYSGLYDIACGEPRTFGAALERARAVARR